MKKINDVLKNEFGGSQKMMTYLTKKDDILEEVTIEIKLIVVSDAFQYLTFF